MKNLAHLMLLIALLCMSSLLLVYASTPLTCDTTQQAKICPKYHAPGSVGASNDPLTQDIQLHAFKHSSGEATMAFVFPFCRKCGYIFSRYPISYRTHPLLVADTKSSSLGGTGAFDTPSNWKGLWTTGNNMCGITPLENPMMAETELMSLEPVDTCTVMRILKPLSYDQKLALTDDQGKKVYEVKQEGRNIVIKTNFYAQAVFPYSMDTSSEKYSTKQRTIQQIIKYEMDASVISDANVMTEKLVRVRVTPDNKLDVKLEFKTPTNYYPYLNGCGIMSSTNLAKTEDWGVYVDKWDKISTNSFKLQLYSNLKTDRYTGVIRGECAVEVCDGTDCKIVAVNFAIEIDQFANQESIATTLFTPTTKQYMGSKTHPFIKETSIASTSDERVGIAIGTEETLVGFKSEITYLKMCSEACTSNSEFVKEIIKDGLMEDTEFANKVGLMTYSNIDMRAAKLALPGVAPLGFSFLIDRVKSTRYTTWVFQVGMKYTPITNKKRSLLKASAATKQESSSFVKTIKLLPDISPEPSTDGGFFSAFRSGKNAVVNVISVVSIVSIILLCAFGLLFLIAINICFQLCRSHKTHSTPTKRQPTNAIDRARIDDLSDGEEELMENVNM